MNYKLIGAKIMKKSIVGIILFCLIQNLIANDELEQTLRENANGEISSRFRIGTSIGFGYQGNIDNNDGNMKINGSSIELGLYGLFNPIRNLFDIEIGINGKYNIGKAPKTNNLGETTYYSRFGQIMTYGGIIFRLGEKKSNALSIGILKSLYMEEFQKDKEKDNGVEKHDLEDTIGAYIEYQVANNKKLFKEIVFIRMEIEKIDISSNNETNENIVGTILIGIKL